MKRSLSMIFLVYIATAATAQDLDVEMTTTIMFTFADREYGDEPDAGVVWKKVDNDTHAIQSGWLRLPNCASNIRNDEGAAKIELSAKAARRLLTILKYYSPTDSSASSRTVSTKKPSAIWNPSVPALDANGGYFVRNFTALATRMNRSGGCAYHLFEDSEGDFAVVVQVDDSMNKEVLGTRPALWGRIWNSEENAPELLSFIYPAPVFATINSAVATLSVGIEGAVLQGPNNTALLRLLKKQAENWVVQSSSLDLRKVVYPRSWQRYVATSNMDQRNIVSQMALDSRSWWKNGHQLDPEVLLELWGSQ